MSQKHNIYEAFLYKYKKFIIALSYTPGFDISYVINDINSTFNFKVIKLDGPDMLNSDSIFNYDKLNKDISDILNSDKEKLNKGELGFYGSGILIYGITFSEKSLKFKIDLQLHFSTSMNMFLKTNNSTVEIYNKFRDLLTTNKINKYFNIKTNPTMELNDAVFEKIIDYLEFRVYGKDYAIYSTKKKKENEKKPLEPLYNKKVVSALEQSSKDQKVVESYNKDMIDLALSTSADDIDNDPRYADKKIHTSSYEMKKLEASLSDIDDDVDIDTDS